MIKDMKLVFEVDNNNETLRRTVTDRNGNLIWDSGVQDSNAIDNSEEGLDAWEQQMKLLSRWNIVEVERVYL